MSDDAYRRVQSNQQGPLYVNLASIDLETGKCRTLVIQWRETSRNLTKAEFESPEVQALLRRKTFLERGPLKSEQPKPTVDATPKAAEDQNEDHEGGEDSSKSGKKRRR